MNNAPKLLDRVRECISARHYSIRTENSYVDWARRFILFHGKRPSACWRYCACALKTLNLSGVKSSYAKVRAIRTG
ncbi:MAG TPA: phage integrase N-terminal SAM-like domain-containing protein [Nitrosomonas sp.]|nr:phage integrase N-terminal SAM-like domain-containing protein [Nitrosomonas sp.]HQX13413.1 phage integrase N-terminal SAM-like domain-containing protein [Nitrosomonas sp.]HRB21258.1 phage integrase N-terminal SAM-like domain-containing protein [Nitrosomonas sp.]HRB31676.1 phage integrase N-terminal SAM-like domain-containing protein [Nitrosomonas sp.]HRB44484.1 phage integrase N-terminal SAM-like domain-containing protein [Nitrosomonas sp.]